jgi:hypothetical protein
MSERVEQIAKTEVPPRAMAHGAGGAISKAADNGGEGVEMVDQNLVAKALAGMNERDRVVTMIKAAHLQPNQRIAALATHEAERNGIRQ